MPYLGILIQNHVAIAVFIVLVNADCLYSYGRWPRILVYKAVEEQLTAIVVSYGKVLHNIAVPFIPERLDTRGRMGSGKPHVGPVNPDNNVTLRVNPAPFALHLRCHLCGTLVGCQAGQ